MNKKSNKPQHFVDVIELPWERVPEGNKIYFSEANDDYIIVREDEDDLSDLEDCLLRYLDSEGIVPFLTRAKVLIQKMVFCFGDGKVEIEYEYFPPFLRPDI